jgi:hypothetical protein
MKITFELPAPVEARLRTLANVSPTDSDYEMMIACQGYVCLRLGANLLMTGSASDQPQRVEHGTAAIRTPVTQAALEGFVQGTKEVA